MSVTLALFAVGAITTLLSSGYLFGARRGVQARATLREELSAKSAALSSLTQQVQILRHDANAGLRKDLDALLEPLRAQEQRNEEAVRAVLKLVQPVLEKDRLSQDLETLPQLGESRSGLVELLNSIAERGSFGAVVLSDDSGLPLAASSACRSPEILAGTSSLLLILAERIPRHGASRPHSFVLHDEAGNVTLHRIFTVGNKRYLLSIISNTAKLSPDMFDPALARLRTVLAA